MEDKTLDGYVDDEDTKIEVIFDEDEGFITFILNDYNETKIKFDWDTIKQLGLEMSEIPIRINKTIRTIYLG